MNRGELNRQGLQNLRLPTKIFQGSFPGLNFWIQPGLLPRQTNISPENWWLKDDSFFLKRFWGHVNFRCRGGGDHLIEVGKSPRVSIVKFKVAIYDASAMTVGNITVRNSGFLPVTNTQRLVVCVYIWYIDILGGGFKDFFSFTPTWGNDPIWLIFIRWVETTN